MKNRTERAEALASGSGTAKYSRTERAMQFAAFDALEICRTEHTSAERMPENEQFPEMYRGPEFDIEIC